MVENLKQLTVVLRWPPTV